MSDPTLFRATRVYCRSVSSDMEESDTKTQGGDVPVRVNSDRRGSDWESTTLLDKTKYFFQTCDVEGKSFITRTDMRRLHRELPLTAEELENVFDSLDTDQNGYLTLEEFSTGFKESSPTLPNPWKPSDALYQTQWDERLTGGVEDDEEKHFCMLLESLGASNVFEDPGEVRSLWAQLRRDEPHLLSNFEEFLARVTFQIKDAKEERKEMESALLRKTAIHDSEIRRLYEEMEQQIKNEKDTLLLKDSERLQSRSHDLEHQLSSKERELEQLFQKQKKLELQCRDLSCEQQESRVENVKLKMTNEELSRELESTCQELSLAQEQLAMLQDQAARLKQEKEMLVEDDTGNSCPARSPTGNYGLANGYNDSTAPSPNQVADAPEQAEVEAQDEVETQGVRGVRVWERISKFESGNLLTPTQRQRPRERGREWEMGEHTEKGKSETGGDGLDAPPDGWPLRRVISIEEDHLPHLLQGGPQPLMHQLSEEDEDDGGDEEDSLEDTRPPVGKESQHVIKEGDVLAPDRLFKVVMVGNSSVGKTSLLRCFCDGHTHAPTTATVGIDYSVKTLQLDNTQVAMQLWDTAGQERYRSITQQFFRRADGVVVMYDVTVLPSFKAVRPWLFNVKEAAGEGVPILLLGNKTDAMSKREVPLKDAENLARDTGVIFYEVSAYTGYNVTEALVHLARVLKDQEDRVRDTVVLLEDHPGKKKACCK
uniref:EF-hand domain-containing protein n=1 Tax=Esox lucius TaxID=8010 RepID=A0A6Q2YAZ2_ESOLU